MVELSDLVKDVKELGRTAMYSPLVMGMVGCTEQQSDYLHVVLAGGVVLIGAGFSAYFWRESKKQDERYTPTNRATITPTSRARMRGIGQSGSDYNFTPVILDNSSYSSGSESGSRGDSHQGGSHSDTGGHSCSSGHSCGGGSSCGGGGGCGGGGCGGGCGGS